MSDNPVGAAIDSVYEQWNPHAAKYPVSSIPAHALENFDTLKTWTEGLLRAGDALEYDVRCARMESRGQLAWHYAKQ